MLKRKKIIKLLLIFSLVFASFFTSKIYANIIMQEDLGSSKKYLPAEAQAIKKLPTREKKQKNFDKNDEKSNSDNTLNELEEMVAEAVSAGQALSATKIIYPKTKHNFKEEECGNNIIITLSKNKNYDYIVIFLHGGAFLGNLGFDQLDFCDKLLDTLNAKIFIPQYGILPKYNYKESYDLMLDLYKDLLKENKKIVIIGDSAGASISLGFMQYLKNENVQLPYKQVLISPWVDLTLKNPDIAKFEGRGAYVGLHGFMEVGKKWAGATDIKNYQVSPIFGDLGFLPETLLFTASLDFLYPDVMLLYKKLQGRNVSTILVIGQALFHDYPMYPIPEADVARTMISTFINK